MTWANAVTILRLALIPLFLHLISTGEAHLRYFAAFVFVLSGLTDILDGYLARKRNEVSRFGTLVDPLADKLMVLSAFWVLVVDDIIPLWIALVILGKELAMIVGASILLVGKTRVISASYLGKAATLILYVGLTMAIVGINSAIVVILVGVAVSLAAGADYFLQAVRLQ